MSFFVPRSGRLNSDVISLALNEILVIPPHEDVMEEMIEAVGNISFVQGNESSLSRRPHSRGPSPPAPPHCGHSRDGLCRQGAAFSRPKKNREDIMLRFGLTLFLCCAALHAQAAGNDLGACLDPSTTLLAGGDVSDKELAAGQSACAHLKQTTQDDKLLLRINAASSTLATEAQRRGKH